MKAFIAEVSRKFHNNPSEKNTSLHCFTCKL